MLTQIVVKANALNLPETPIPISGVAAAPRCCWQSSLPDKKLSGFKEFGVLQVGAYMAVLQTLYP